jgi:PAS domain-containing serine/threonine kinase
MPIDHFPFSCPEAGYPSSESDILCAPLSERHVFQSKRASLSHNRSTSDCAPHLTAGSHPSNFKPPFHTSKHDVHPLDADPFSLSFSTSYEESTLNLGDTAFVLHDPDSSCHDAFFDAESPPLSRQASGISLDGKTALPLFQFPPGHLLNPFFTRTYALQDELGSGGYGFVMTARHRIGGHEVAVKFIIKEKVPDSAWMVDEEAGRLPTEILLLTCINHENIVKCLDLFEDALYFYLASLFPCQYCFSLFMSPQVQELHGSPWPKANRNISSQGTGISSPVSHNMSSSPLLSPSVSEDSLTDLEPHTPPQSCVQLDTLYFGPHSPTHDHLDRDISEPQQQTSPQLHAPSSFPRRLSHDLFECIEHKPLSEDQARYIFSQVVEAVYYLDTHGITHRDIKDENIVIDKDHKVAYILLAFRWTTMLTNQKFQVKLIDFGSAIIVNPNQPRPWYDLFFGTAAYAAPEITLKKRYQAAPAEIWTLGILLSYLLTGTPPFPTAREATEGRIMLADIPGRQLTRASMSLMRRCLNPDPKRRADIREVRAHRWLLNNVLNQT